LEVNKLFLALSAAFAAIPGVAVIASGLGTPPGTYYKWLFGGVIEAFGALALLLLWVNKNKLSESKKKLKITRAALIMGVLCFVLIAVYVLLFQHTVVEHARGTAYYPLWLDGTIERMVERAGSREAAIENYGIAGVQKGIDEMGGGTLALTSILLLLVYQGIFTSLTLSFGLPGFHMRQSLLSKAANKTPPQQQTPPAAEP
jgi:hypothetical protein